jgi:hypothetical protein
MYVADIESKAMDPNARPAVLKESPATAWVDGNNGLGPVVGNFCMQLAIQKAKAAGVGWVVAKGTYPADRTATQLLCRRLPHISLFILLSRSGLFRPLDYDGPEIALMAAIVCVFRWVGRSAVKKLPFVLAT